MTVTNKENFQSNHAKIMGHANHKTDLWSIMDYKIWMKKEDKKDYYDDLYLQVTAIPIWLRAQLSIKKRKRAKGKMACSSSGINTMETQHMHGKQENRQGEHQR